MNDSQTLFRPPWLNLARGLWLAVALISIVAAIDGAWVYFQHPLPDCVAGTVPCAPWTVSAQDVALATQNGLPVWLMQLAQLLNFALPRIGFLAVGWLIFWRKSDDWMALLLSLMLIGFVTEGVTDIGIGVLTPIVQLIYAFITAVFLLLPFIFPSGRFVPRWIVWVAVPLTVGAALPGAFPQLAGGVDEQLYALWLLGSFAVWFVLGGYAVIYRYRHVSSAQERQQTKWVMAGILGTFVIFIPFTIISVRFPPSQPSLERLAFYFFVYLPIGLVGYLFIPISIAVAIFKYRLWDIDVIIRKTLTYAIVATLLLFVYFGTVIVLQRLFVMVSGYQGEAVTVVSTLAIAVLFVPLRNRIQDLIDKRFYRKKFDSRRVMEHYAQTMRDETDLDTLTGELVQVVQETMQPKSVSLWLKREGKR